MDRAWIYVVFTDTVHSTEASKKVRERHLEVVKQAIEENRQHLRLIEGQHVRKVGDEYKAEFTGTWPAIRAALRIHRRTEDLSDGLVERIGLGARPFAGELDEDYYQTVTQAKRIMEICPGGFILCSEDLLDRLGKSEFDALEVHGPFFTKLKGFVRPVPLYFIGQAPHSGLKLWQPGEPGPGERSVLGLFRTGGSSEILATLFVERVWSWFRDFGRYRYAQLWFSILNSISRRFIWKRLELHSSIGLSDVTMLLDQPEASIYWAKHVGLIANRIGDEYYQTMADYLIGHSLAHAAPTEEAESYLRKSYSGFEDLADARMAGWSALHLGRCLRGLRRLAEAEDWILASVLIFASAGPHKRGIAFAILQMARLRASQDCFPDVWWYLERVRQLYPTALNAE